ncbi:hypothetical protein EHP00_887 [Ecytonucleospora hepatopenaei]|uniref:Uncharacterized protein n=1 Tax=Ecytonucleospora hepatopenaei TaxID=646526 RepID=A0A1W0E3X1_9MICR|nr:hypothetical protein EHP00_887 [Ecytonucleospora hepatopenaei]
MEVENPTFLNLDSKFLVKAFKKIVLPDPLSPTAHKISPVFICPLVGYKNIWFPKKFLTYM